MKKIILFVLVLTVIFSFSYQLSAKGEEKILIKRPEPVELTQQLSAEEMQAKRDRLFQAKYRRQELYEKFGSPGQRISADNPNAVDIQLDSSYTNWQNQAGDVYMTALCYNAGTSYAAMVEAEVDFYDINQNYLGYDTGWVYGGTYNVQYGTSGYCTNEIAPGEYGFFWVWPDVSYADAYYYSVNFTAEDSTTYPWANAWLDFYGSVYKQNTAGLLEFYGDVKNYSSNYVTYYTEVHFAVFNNDDSRVLDVDWDFVDGATYGSSTSAIYPQTYEPFDVWFLFADYNQASGSYFNSFEWYEAVYSPLPELNPPFGQFATPIDQSNVASSIAVTGWALDDSGVEHVKIYRGQGSQLLFVGDASFVEGARPDVAAAYPQYPNNTRAGWGYMLLTNFLPNGGNGTYTLYAIATDAVGKTTTLGSKTIYCDNANAVKPFGAIDTPSQGGTASGSSYVNWGWALTPQPNYIPTDGSTLNVFVDGVNLGNPTYNVYRADLASLFPGYANSNGAAGYFYLDTTAYANGVHTIQWTARDSGGNSDGIGSRYFTINNTSPSSPSSVQGMKTAVLPLLQIDALPVENFSPVRVKQGYDEDSLPIAVPLDEKGMNRVVIPEMERIEIHLSDLPALDTAYSGYLVVGDRMMSLPVGSTLNPQTGVFSWIPGPGHLGSFHLVFIKTAPDGAMSKKDAIVEIVPKQY
ncbi:MAG: hypothetical protein JSV88_17485 [Candidatus Aminicenantes bacterium]|nr:MAG: hypothetical protein JSV88_17485 [Candidatus Aminicenantes bacterium]